MKTNYTSETPCFYTHKKEKATRNRFKGLKANKKMIILQQSNEKKSLFTHDIWSPNPAPAEQENMLQD